MKNIFSKLNIGKKVVNCPSCHQKVRIPIKSGKTLRIKCPKCSAEFDIRFANPISEVLKWDKHLSFKDNFKAVLWRFRSLPGRAKFSLLLLLASIFLLVTSMTARCSVNTIEKKRDAKPQSQKLVMRLGNHE
ncbi:hypothetical protein ACFLZV_00865 [Candidatus Margulisiibacteriota bacterium]